MLNTVGRTIASSQLTDGSIINIFNATCKGLDSAINFYEPNNSTAKYIISSDSNASYYRCAYFTYTTQSSPNDNLRLVLYVNSIFNASNQSGGTFHATPLWELISPTINKFSNDTYQLSWWSNVKDYNKLNQQYENYYLYDTSYLYRFKSSQLDDIEESTTAAKILCTAYFKLQYLKQVGGGITSDKAQYAYTPVIYDPCITAVIKNDGYILDFAGNGSGTSTGSNGGGLGVHNHTSNKDGGLGAAAYFMPSSTMRPLNWS